MKSSVIGIATLASVALGASAVVAVPPASAASDGAHYTYKTVTVKVHGAVCHRIEMAGINDHGTVVGSALCGASVGFVRRSDGSTVQFRVPGPPKLITQTTSIASNGNVSLYTYTRVKKPVYASYLRSSGGKLTPLANPLAGAGGSQVLAVNATRVAVGDYYSKAKTPTLLPFVSRNGVVHRFVLGIPHATNVILTGITDAGVISGQYSDGARTVRGFFATSDGAHTVKVPGAPVARKRGSGISSIGKGEVLTGDIYRKAKTTGFVRHGGHFSIVDVPGSLDTYCQAVNHNKRVVGFYLTRSGLVRGFVATLTITK